MLEDFENLADGLGSEVGRWQYLLLFAKSDEQCRCDEYGLTHYNAAHECCSECLANRSDLPWSDLQPSASWRPTVIENVGPYLARIRTPLHPLAASRFMWRHFFVLDIMHVADCRGLASVIFGSMLTYLISLPALGRSQAARLARINAFIEGRYDNHPGLSKLPKLTLACLWNDGWSDLSGPSIKSAMTRQAAPLMAELATAFCILDNLHDNLVKRLTSKLDEFYCLLYASDTFLSPEQLARLGVVVQELLGALQHLRHLADTTGAYRWVIRPKAHKFAHLPFVAGSINPLKISCYSDESHIGTLTKVWSKSISGRYSREAQRNVLSKRWLAVLLRFHLNMD